MNASRTTRGQAANFPWADPPSGLVFAFTCNRFQELHLAHERFRELADACWAAVGRCAGAAPRGAI